MEYCDQILHTLILKSSNPTYCQNVIYLEWGIAEVRILKSETCLISYTMCLFWIKCCIHIDIDKLYCIGLPNDLPDGIFWWNFAYTLIWTRSKQGDCEIPFSNGRGFAEVKLVKIAITLRIIWIKCCIHIDIDKIYGVAIYSQLSIAKER